MNDPLCPTCRTAMEEGFLLDRGHLNFETQAEWVEGPPVQSWWSGLRLKGKQKLAATTYRCPTCGLLQSYARDAV